MSTRLYFSSPKYFIGGNKGGSLHRVLPSDSRRRALLFLIFAIRLAIFLLSSSSIATLQWRQTHAVNRYRLEEIRCHWHISLNVDSSWALVKCQIQTAQRIQHCAVSEVRNPFWIRVSLYQILCMQVFFILQHVSRFMRFPHVAPLQLSDVSSMFCPAFYYSWSMFAEC